MEFIEYRGFKNIFLGLVKDKDKGYFIFYGKTGKINVNFENNIDRLFFESIHTSKYIANYKERRANIEIPLWPDNKGTLFSLIAIPNKETYSSIINILEDTL